MIVDSTAPPERRSHPAPVGMVVAGESIIGLSKQHRAIACVRRGHAAAPLKVLILAGQHGDERPARRLLESLLSKAPAELAARLPALQLAIIPEANPDGCAARSRCNADGIDPNRDHQLLRSGETAAIHLFVRRWQPQIILDLHNYPSRRRHLLARNVVLDHDVFIDVPNHPAILARPGGVDPADVLRDLLRAIAARDVRADRYTIVGTSGRARHSTPDVVDARNGLALRYGTFTILVENRQPRRNETAAGRGHLREAQERAVWAVLEWLNENHGLFAPLLEVSPPTPGSPVPVHFKYSDTKQGLRLECRDANEDRPLSVTFPRYSASLEVRRAVPLPSGYAVPSALEELTGVLLRHGFVRTPCRAGELCRVEKLRIEPVRPSRRPDRTPRKAVLAVQRTSMELDRYDVFHTQQRCGDALAVYLEPESKHGLHRFAALQVPMLAPCWYPVLRVFEGYAQRNGCL